MHEKAPRGQNWSITIHDHKEYGGEESLKAHLTNLTYKYMLFGKEICPTTGKEHLQGFMIFNSNKSLKGLRKELFPWAPHLEKSYAGAVVNIRYCKKDGNIWFEDGDPPKGQGLRVDLKMIKQRMEAGATVSEMIDDGMINNFQQIQLAEKLNKYIKFKRTKPVVVWVYGPTGCGKTKFVHDNYSDVYVAMNNKWWDGYENQSVILIDDLRAEDYPFNYLLRLLDAYPLQLEIKGGSVQLRNKMFIITCPETPVGLFGSSHSGEDIGQLTRRIDKIIHGSDLQTLNPDDILSSLSASGEDDL